MKQLNAVIARWLQEAKKFRACAAELEDCNDNTGEEIALCETEAARLEQCANDVREALKNEKAA